MKLPTYFREVFKMSSNFIIDKIYDDYEYSTLSFSENNDKSNH